MKKIRATRRLVKKHSNFYRYFRGKGHRSRFCNKIVEQLHPDVNDITDNQFADLTVKIRAVKQFVKQNIISSMQSVINAINDDERRSRFRAAIRSKKMKRRWTEIAYSMAARDINLLNKKNFYIYITNRNFRILFRMDMYANFSRRSSGYFYYPHQARPRPPGEHYSLNLGSGNSWEEAGDTNRSYRFILSSEGRNNPSFSLLSLFTSQQSRGLANVLDCSRTTNVLLLDSLLTGNNNAFMKNLVSGASSHRYIDIYIPSAFNVNNMRTNAIFDQTSNGLFDSVRNIKSSDFTPGDHFYMRNHPLYLRLIDGPWQGEHSLLSNYGPSRSRRTDENRYLDYKTVGFGLSTDRIINHYRSLRVDLNTSLSRAAAALKHHMKQLRGIVFEPELVQVTVDEGKYVKNGLKVNLNLLQHEYHNERFRYIEFTLLSNNNVKRRVKRAEHIVLRHYPENNKLIIVGIGEGSDDGEVWEYDLFVRTKSGKKFSETDVFDLETSYFVKDTQTYDTRSLFTTTGKVNYISLKEMKELDSPFLTYNGNNDKIYVNRPKIDMSDVYLAHIGISD